MVVNKLGSRYLVFDEIASGGMANVHYGIARGQGGFRRVVAIKRLHESWARDPEFSALFLDEARMTSRIQHPNVVSMIDVVEEGREIFIVMEYVAGAPLSQLSRLAQKRETRVPEDVAASILVGVLSGLHAAHEATDDRGAPLELVHRDVSPQNILVGSDGLAKVVDFGIAKAAGRSTTTRDGKLKGKLGYMAPEQLLGKPATRQSDIWSASVVLWELLTGRRLFSGDSEGEVVAKVTQQRAPPLRELAPDISPELERVVMQGLSRNPLRRFDDAKQMALALESAIPLASAARVGAWVEELAGPSLKERSARVRAIEAEAATDSIPPPVPPDPPVVPSERRRLPFVVVTVIAASIAVAAGVFLLFWRQAPGTPASAPLPSAEATTVAVSATPILSASSAPASTSTSRATSVGRVLKPKAGKPAVTGSARSPNCYTKDAEGIWHIKPQCL